MDPLYLQIDPSIFTSKAPQYIIPEGNEHGKGKFEFALGHIGWAVGGGFFAGCARGFVPELFNHDTRQLTGKPLYTRLINSTVKYGSGYAQPAGTAILLYSLVEIGLKSIRDENDSFVVRSTAGAAAGALYRSPHGLRATGQGAIVGLFLATCWATLVHYSNKRRL